jgi:hypothetical protein
MKYFAVLYSNTYAPMRVRALNLVCRNYNADSAHARDPLKTATLQMWGMSYEEAQKGFPSKPEIRADVNCAAPVVKTDAPPAPEPIGPKMP